jgi:hypothetical protein
MDPREGRGARKSLQNSRPRRPGQHRTGELPSIRGHGNKRPRREPPTPGKNHPRSGHNTRPLTLTARPRVPATRPEQPDRRCGVDNSIPGKRQGVDEQQHDPQRSHCPPSRHCNSHAPANRRWSTPNTGYIPRRPTSRHNTTTHGRPTRQGQLLAADLVPMWGSIGGPLTHFGLSGHK